MPSSEKLVSAELPIPPWRGPVILTLAIATLWIGFAIPSNWGVILSILSFVPVMFGAHEALHDTLLPPMHSQKIRSFLNEVFLVLGFAAQLMNFRLLRPAHKYHHVHGRYDDGYAPDILGRHPNIGNYLRYYLTLCGRPAIFWQLACSATLIIPLRRVPFAHTIDFQSEKSPTPYWVAQFVVFAFAVAAIWAGGWFKFFLYWAAACFIWSLLQNVSHYGLKGFDPTTDRVCARTYCLQEPFHSLTFGSTCHLAHHVFDDIPGLQLGTGHVIDQVQKRLNVTIEVKRGIIDFLKDVIAQFNGPMMEDQLTTEWARPNGDRPMHGQLSPGGFKLREGRTWKRLHVKNETPLPKIHHPPA